MKPKRRRDPFERIEARVDVVQKVKTEGVNPFEELLKIYRVFLEINDIYQTDDMFEKGFPRDRYFKQVLSPLEINQFLQITGSFDQELFWDTIKTGKFINRLLQQSYNAGNNNFMLNQNGIRPLVGLCNNLVGKKEKPFVIQVKGIVGYGFGNSSRNLEAEIEEAGDSFGSDLYEGCKFRVKKVKDFAFYCLLHKTGIRVDIDEAGDYFAGEAKGGTFIARKVGDLAVHQAVNINMTVQEAGNNFAMHAQKCTFQTSNRSLYERLIEETRCSENTFIYNKPNGTPEVYRT